MFRGKPSYAWGESPEHLRTVDQLRDERLRPAKPREPDGYVVWGSTSRPKFARLYQRAAAVPIKEMTEAQRAGLDRATAALRTCPVCQID